jgi:hypothetical protein
MRLNPTGVYSGSFLSIHLKFKTYDVLSTYTTTYGVSWLVCLYENSKDESTYQDKCKGGQAPIVMALVKVFRTRQDITEDVRKWENDFEEGKE